MNVGVGCIALSRDLKCVGNLPLIAGIAWSDRIFNLMLNGENIDSRGEVDRVFSGSAKEHEKARCIKLPLIALNSDKNQQKMRLCNWVQPLRSARDGDCIHSLRLRLGYPIGSREFFPSRPISYIERDFGI
jgi:hypothetical protein